MNKFNNYFLDTVKKNYANFNGRASRTQYWYFVLFSVLISIALTLVDVFVINPFMGMDPVEASNGGMLTMIFALVMLIPQIAIGVRRLHDTGKSGWWYLIALIPILGALVLLFFFITDSQRGINKYGNNPKGF